MATELVENPWPDDHQEEQERKNAEEYARINAEEKQPFAWRGRRVSQSILATVNLQSMGCGNRTVSGTA
ncbi:hypothetical protein [Mycobacterium sp. NS-7484]|uniref:hypothetical protein n=1 Tax=Mycobacterium sp. NS-7484 TaxID=1834161 RepID=UPI00114E1129|nr:hypothetical protein [Mycobacterium sp. NS-7484]